VLSTRHPDQAALTRTWSGRSGALSSSRGFASITFSASSTGGGAPFLSADLDVTPEVRDDHAAYIASWIKVLKDDKRAIFTAAGHAQRAAAFLHERQPQPEPEPDDDAPATCGDTPEEGPSLS